MIKLLDFVDDSRLINFLLGSLPVHNYNYNEEELQQQNR